MDIVCIDDRVLGAFGSGRFHQDRLICLLCQRIHVSQRYEGIVALIEPNLAGIQTHLRTRDNGRPIKRNDASALFETGLLGDSFKLFVPKLKVTSLNQLQQSIRPAIEARFRSIGRGLPLA